MKQQRTFLLRELGGLLTYTQMGPVTVRCYRGSDEGRLGNAALIKGGEAQYTGEVFSL